MNKQIMLHVLFSSLITGAALAADVSSQIFYEYTHEATEGGTRDGSFETGRAYLTVTDKPADNLSYKLQFDVGRMNDGADDSDKLLEVYVKNACVDWQTAFGKWTFGMQGMNMFNVQENTFGYRFLAKPLMDEHKFSSSADMGVGYSNEFAGLVKASVLYTNGTGYKKAEDDKYKKLSLQVLAGEAALNKKDGWNVGLAYSNEAINADDGVAVMGLFGGWAGMGVRVGAEFDTKTTTGATDLTEQILGFYGTYKLPVEMPLELFAQMDMYDHNTDADDDGKTDLIIGIKASPVKGLVIAPNYRTISSEVSGSDPETWYRINFEFKI